MAEFLDVIETIRAESASVQRLFGGEGRASSARRQSQDPVYLAKLAEAAAFIAAVYQGKRPVWQLQEALTTSDFANLFGDVLDRQLLANYSEAPYSWNQYCRRAVVQDFRAVKRFYLNGSEGGLAQVQQATDYPEGTLADGAYTYSVAKYGRKLPIAWESIVNDDLQALQDIPQRLGRAARRTEERFATGLFVGSTGLNTSFFSSGNKNALSGNPALSVNSLSTAITALMSMVDADGEPILVEGMTLVVPPALLQTARTILNATEIRIALDNANSTYQQVSAPSWTQDIVQIAVNYYIPIVATSNGATSWFLFANPATTRPAVELGFLRGHETPEIFMKAPNAQRVGGGVVSEDFDTDSLVYKVRHVVGGAVMEPKSAIGSNGSGS